MSRPTSGHVIVVGAGIAGLSTAWALHRRGFRVSVFEQGPIPNPVASSYDEHRITRHAYGVLEGYAYMMPRAFELFDAMFRDIGAVHLKPSPVVYIERDPVDWYEPVTRCLRNLGKAFRDIGPDELAERFPMVRPEGISRVTETEHGGMLFPIRILTDLAVFLGNAGVRLHAHTKVTAVDPDAGTVEAAGETHRADRIVIAAGAWVNGLTDAVAADVVASRQAVMFLSPPTDLVPAWNAIPILIDLGTESGTYVLPAWSGTRLKIGDHVFTRAGDADAGRVATDGDLERLNRAARLAFRDFDRYQVIERKVCYYTVTRDESERFAVRPWGARAWVQSACSGHGFKLGPLIGESVAAAVAGETSAEDTIRYCAGLMGQGEMPRRLAAAAE
jgi:sarcosine oxidase/sarcosine oxidase subunit beta